MLSLDIQNSLKSIQSLTSFVESAANQYVVKPFSNSGLSGYLFDIMDDEDVQFASEITDHYVENNISVQDHIALRPVKVTLRGFVGEISDTVINSILNNLTQAQGIDIVEEYYPSFAIQSTQVYNEYATAVQSSQNAISQASNLYNLFFQKSTNSSKQQNAFAYFYSMWGTRQLFTVETPYQTFSNMAIESVQAIQRGDTKTVSEFSVTFKQIRIAQTVISISGIRAISRAANILAQQRINAQTQGQEASISTLEKTYKL